jgi:hypothetical protein
MSKEKRDRANLLDPNREKIARLNAVMPGGPQNNNPMNVTSITSPAIRAESIYGDYEQNYQAMGSGVNPMMVDPSGLQQNFPMGQRLNAEPYGGQQQPDTAGASMAPDGMESGRLASEAQKYGLNPGPMGMTGMAAQPAPGAFPPAFPGSSGPKLMAGMQSAEQATGFMGPMTPGSTPTKIKKKVA